MHTRDYFDSGEEFIFYCWLLEAKYLGVIVDFKIKPDPILITQKETYTYTKTTRSKVKKIKSTKEVEGTLLNPWSYTPDFYVIADLSEFHKGTHKLVPANGMSGVGVYIIDTKGSGARFKDDTKFPLIQKALFLSRGLYANKLVPKYFFKNAWLPRPISKKDDLIWTDYQVLKSGKIKPQRKRSPFKDCLTWEEKIKSKTNP